MTQKINRNSNLNAHRVFKKHRMLISLHAVYGCSHTTSQVSSCDKIMRPTEPIIWLFTGKVCQPLCEIIICHSCVHSSDG